MDLDWFQTSKAIAMEDIMGISEALSYMGISDLPPPPPPRICGQRNTSSRKRTWLLHVAAHFCVHFTSDSIGEVSDVKQCTVPMDGILHAMRFLAPLCLWQAELIR